MLDDAVCDGDVDEDKEEVTLSVAVCDALKEDDPDTEGEALLDGVGEKRTLTLSTLCAPYGTANIVFPPVTRLVRYFDGSAEDHPSSSLT